MGLVTAKLEETAAHVVALSILLLNLRKIQCAFLQFLDWLLGLLQSREKRMVIQWTLDIAWPAAVAPVAEVDAVQVLSIQSYTFTTSILP